MLFFLEIIQLLVEETNRYYQEYLDILDEGCFPLPDASVQTLYIFLSITVQMGHDQKDCWSTPEQFLHSFTGIQ
jgi:hypothetical protein